MSLAQQAGIACNDPLFRSFLKAPVTELVKAKHIEATDMNGNPQAWTVLRTPEQAAIAVRVLCEIDSRRDLDREPGAAARWREMHADFEVWRRGI
jgi:hypothetical protein